MWTQSTQRVRERKHSKCAKRAPHTHTFPDGFVPNDLPILASPSGKRCWERTGRMPCASVRKTMHLPQILKGRQTKYGRYRCGREGPQGWCRCAQGTCASCFIFSQCGSHSILNHCLSKDRSRVASIVEEEASSSSAVETLGVCGCSSRTSRMKPS